MEQLIFRDRLYIRGSAKEVIDQLRMLTDSFNTIKELYRYKMNPEITDGD